MTVTVNNKMTMLMIAIVVVVLTLTRHTSSATAIERSSSTVPIIDLSSWTTKGKDGGTVVSISSSSQLSKDQARIVDQVRFACENIGFFMISGHGVDDTVIDEAYDGAELFFNLPTGQKLRHKTHNETEYPYGYEQSETLVKGRRIDDDDDGDDDLVADMKDLKETYSIGPNNPLSGMPPRRFIDADNSTTIQTFSESIETYYQHMEELAMKLLQIFGIALDFDFLSNMDRHMSALRVLNYYPLETPRNKQHIVRAGAHTDYGALTILSARDPGLEVFLRSNDVDSSTDTSSGNKNHTEKPKRQWFPVHVVPNTLVINLGDLMQRWTNDKWVSTLHRVAMPSTNAFEQRKSIAFFCNVNGDTVIEPLQSCRTDDDVDKQYPPVTARQHLMAKHLASMSVVTMDSESSKSGVDSGVGDGDRRHERSTGVQDEL